MYRLTVQMEDNGAVAPLSQNSDKKLSPINRLYRVGWGVQPKSPDTTILRLNIMGSVPLRSFAVKRWHTTHDWVLMCVFSCVLFSKIHNIPPYCCSLILLLHYKIECNISILE